MSDKTPITNGNGHSRFAIRMSNLVKSPSFLESGSFGVAEIISMGVSLGVVGVADQVAPNLLKTASKAVSKAVVEPYLDFIESAMTRFCKLEECKIDKEKPREERAQELSHTLVVFGAAWAFSMAAKLTTRRVLTGKMVAHNVNSPHYIPHPDDKKIFGVTKHEWKLFGVDEGIHYGSLILLNTGMAKYTDELIKASTNILHKCGLSEKKAHELSSMAMIWELPNFLGLLGGLGVISHRHNHDWGQNKS